MATTDLEANKWVVREFFARWTAGRLTDAFELVDMKGEWWLLTFGSTITLRTWTEAIRDHEKDFRQLDITIELETAEDDRVSVLARSFGVGIDGREYRNHYHYLFVIRDGRIVGGYEFSDPRLADDFFRGGQHQAAEVWKSQVGNRVGVGETDQAATNIDPTAASG